MTEEMMTTTAAEEMDLTQYLPSLDGLQSSLAFWMKILVIIGPIVMLLLGLYYYFLSPKEANYSAGYRFRYAMSRVRVWQFAQKSAGIAFGSLGLIFLIVMLCMLAGFNDLSAPDGVWRAFKCLLWQVIFAFVTTMAVNLIIVIRYDFSGKLRQGKKKGTKENAPEAKSTAPAKQVTTTPAKGSAPKPTGTPARRPAPKTTGTPARRPAPKTTGTPARRPAPKTTGTSTRRPAPKTTGTPTRRPAPTRQPTPTPTRRPATPKPPVSSGSGAFHKPEDLG